MNLLETDVPAAGGIVVTPVRVFPDLKRCGFAVVFGWHGSKFLP
jgi:hypothetical protein